MLIRRVRDGNDWLWQVGSIQHKIGGDAFEPIAEFGTLKEAVSLMNFINGGDGAERYQ